MSQIMGSRGTNLMRYYIDNHQMQMKMKQVNMTVKEPINYKLEIKAFTKQVKNY